ncbi:MAG: CAP domain-containing protein [Spirochaetales bacterium]|nr:CAP domain-containing protein [Spirochaetales bacterium]
MRKCISLLLVFLPFSLFAIEKKDVENWINNTRSEEGLNPLVFEDSLTQSAEKYIVELSAKRFLSHRDEEGGGPLDRYKASGGSALAVGEILGTCEVKAPKEELFEAWWNSPSHREQILDPRWNCMGIALWENGEVLIGVVEFSSSLLSSYSLDDVEGAYLFSFKPISESPLVFTEPLGGGGWTWTREVGDSRYYFEGDFPLLIELKAEEGRGGNRFLFMQPPPGEKD